MSTQENTPTDTLRLEYASLTDVGLLRQHNEDAFGEPLPRYADKLDTAGYLFAVADGMGGHALGELASRLAVDVLFDSYYHSNETEPALALRGAVEVANQTVYYQAGIRGVNMGTTLVAVLLHDQMLVLVNVGDSRIYRFRGDVAQQLTRDHSLVAERIRRGLMTPEQARVSPERNIITRSIGHRLPAEMDLARTPLMPDDVLLLCTDGLHGLVETDEMAAVIASEPLADVPAHLIALANQRGGPDNITCQVIRVISCPARPQAEPAAQPPEEAEQLGQRDEQPASSSEN